jgi:hypothetical protein
MQLVADGCFALSFRASLSRFALTRVIHARFRWTPLSGGVVYNRDAVATSFCALAETDRRRSFGLLLRIETDRFAGPALSAITFHAQVNSKSL